MNKRKNVVVIQRIITQYRKPFHEKLKKQLENDNIDYILIYGSPSKYDSAKQDVVDIPWANKVNSRYINIWGKTLIWFFPIKYFNKILNSDLVITVQASKIIFNYILFLMHKLGIIKLCFWGHGKYFKEHKSTIAGEYIKKIMSKRIHWWFSYNDLSANIVRSLGYSKDRITSVQNTIDTNLLIDKINRYDNRKLDEIRKQFNIRGNNICIYAGGMYKEKRLQFLFDSIEIIKDSIRDFEIIFMGAGTDEDLVKEYDNKYDWVHYIGPKFGDDKIPYFLVSKLLLMPGLVGLVIIDSFVFETPIVTTEITYHSPEIDYLKDSENGIIVKEKDDPTKYASHVIYLLQNYSARKMLIDGCKSSKRKYTMDNMVNNFSLGIKNALIH